MKKFATLLALLGTIVVLLFLMIGLQQFEFPSDTDVFNPKSLAATGFIILAAFSMGEFFKLMKFPALLGYIAAGLVFGPNFPELLPGTPEALFGRSVIEDLSLINVLTIGVIGTMGGGELKISQLKGNLKTIFLVIFFIFLFVVPTSFGAVLLLAEWVPSLLPFLADAGSDRRIAVALLFGVFALAMSPAATLAILQETKARGRFTSLVLGIVVVADIGLVALFLLTFSFDKLLLAPGALDTAKLVAELPHIAAEFGYAILIGIVTGLIFIVYLRFVAKEKLLFTVALIFAAAYAAAVLHAESLAAFLTAGFLVQNFSRQGEDMIHSLEKISLPVFVIYFMTQAAMLDLQAVVGFLGLTLILGAIRAVGLWAGSKLGTKLAGAAETERRYLWLAFFSRGGVDLVLAAMVAQQIPSWGVEFQTVIMAIVVIHIILGPPLLKLSLDWAGETADSRRRTRREAEELDQVPGLGDEVSTPSAAFPVPNFGHAGLNERLKELRRHLVEYHRSYVVKPIQGTAERLREALEAIRKEQETAFAKMGAILDDDAYENHAERADAIDELHVEFRRAISPHVETLQSLDAPAIDVEDADQLISEIHGLERFATLYRVERDEHLFEPLEGDGPFVIALKYLRRIRRFFVGPGQRSIPLGRLWRYFVELSVPRYLARAAAASSGLNETLWATLSSNLRHSDAIFAEMKSALENVEAERVTTRDAAVDASEPDEGSADASGEEPGATGATDEAADAPESTASTVSEVDESHEVVPDTSAARERLAELEDETEQQWQKASEELSRWSTTALDRYTVSLRETFRSFLNAVASAGTLELPAFRYRPSSLFDRSRRAENQLHQRLAREHAIVLGHRGWIVIDHELFLFLDWFESYEEQMIESLRTTLAGPGERQLAVLAERIMERPEADVDDGSSTLDASGEAFVDWQSWLEEKIRPVTRRTHRTFDHMLATFGQGLTVRRLLDPLEARVDELPDRVRIFEQPTEQAANGGPANTTLLPVRGWFEAELVRETALRFVEFNERVDALLHVALDGIDDIQQVVEFNLLTAHRDNQMGDYAHANQLAAGGLERAQRMIGELQKDHTSGVTEIHSWLLSETELLIERTTNPFLEHRLNEVKRTMARRGQISLTERGESWASRQIASVKRAARKRWEHYAPVVEEAAADLRAMLVEEPVRVTNSDIRARLHPHERAGQTSIPTIYRRLFTPVPLDIADFYIERTEVEDATYEAILEWLSGRNHSILLRGDRGCGKRSTLHHIIDTRIENSPAFSDVDFHALRLAEDLATEEDLCLELGTMMREEPPETLDVALRFLSAQERRQIVVIENGEKLYHRTRKGMELCEKFLHTIGRTDDRILWIVLFGTPAAAWLDTAIGLTDYFTHSFDIPPFDEDDVRRMILRRHRVSGFEAHFERPSPSLVDWAFHPMRTSEAVRDADDEFFRHLHHLSGGKPLLALLYWLESARLDDEDDHLIHMEMLPDEELPIAHNISLVKQLILATLIRHSALTPGQISDILRRDLPEIQTELDHLRRLGFVETTAGRNVSCYQLRPLAEALVTRELRDMNMV